MVDNSSDVIRSLRIPHNMRGREAGCNGSIEAVGANVEAYTENNCNAEVCHCLQLCMILCDIIIMMAPSFVMYFIM